MKDKVFSKEKNWPNPFEFNETIAVCFDDMVKRSVPLYNESINLQTELASRFYTKGSVIYDLGCSNGNFGINFLDKIKDKSFSMTAVDNSKPMIELFLKRLDSRPDSSRIKLINDNVENIKIENASVVVMNLTLQFIEKSLRKQLIEKIYKGLNPGGIFLLTEKVLNENQRFLENETKIYYDFKKKNGYSELEISRKREALDNVLVPETTIEHINRLKKAGFSYVDIYLKWFQFTSFIAGKEK
ncbi:MAG: carboxy-S-adenosyl-L-methionine synthase CmoA [Desulforegulaceae bacterium]|nr:carboxy-S-adenosyl-L-methionine synthase CmoA [Desulforegulaceae bacterium]